MTTNDSFSNDNDGFSALTVEDSAVHAISVCHFQLFGEFSVQSSPDAPAVPVRMKTQKASLLLAFLLLHPNRAYSREQVGAFLWPSVGEKSMLASLRTDLNYLRNGLKSAGLPEDLLRIDGKMLGVHTRYITTDAGAFDACLATAEKSPLVSDKIDALETALSLYRGPLLAGMNDVDGAKEWLAAIRCDYVEHEEDILSCLAARYADSGNPQKALEFARRFADRDRSDAARQETVARLTDLIQKREQAVLVDSLRNMSPSPQISEELLTVTIVDVASPEPVKTEPTRSTGRTAVPPGVGFAAAGILGVGIGYLLRPPVPAPSPHPLPKKRVPGDLMEINAFESPSAQGMTEIDYEGALGYYMIQLEDRTGNHTHRQETALRLYTLGYSAHMQGKGRGEITIAAVGKAIEVFQAHRMLTNLLTARLLLAQAYLLQGVRSAALDNMARVERIADSLPSADVDKDVLMLIGETLISLGEYRKAQGYIRLSYQRHPVAEQKAGLPSIDRFLGVIAAETGDYPAAKRYLTRSIERYATIPTQRQTRAAVLGNLGDVFLWEKDTSKATPLYSEGLSVWEGVNQRFWMGQFQLRHARVAYYLGRNDEALRLAGESLRLIEGSNSTVAKAGPLLVQGRLALRDRKRTALDLLTESLRLRRENGNPRLVAEGLEALVQAQHAFGQSASAKSALTEAIRLRQKAATPVPPIERTTIADLRHALQV